MASFRILPASKSRAAFLIASVASAVAAVGQIALGGVVRVTGSGLGCPDWPLCHGRVFPSLEFHTLIEYSHRLSASLLGVLLLAAAIIAWRHYRAHVLVVGTSTAGLVLGLIAAGLGGITVLTELEWWVVVLHLMIAEAIVACMIVAAVAAWRAGDRREVAEGPRERGALNALVAASVIGGIILILSGSLMVGLGYGSSCGTWPLCRGSFLPGGEPYMVHMAHRYLAAVVGALVAGTVISAWAPQVRDQRLRWAAALAAAVFLMQALLGAATVWTGFPAALKSLHLATATMSWASLVFLAAMTFVPGRLELRSAEREPGRQAGLEGATP